METGGDCGDGQEKPATETGGGGGNRWQRLVVAKFDGERRQRGNLLLTTSRWVGGSYCRWLMPLLVNFFDSLFHRCSLFVVDRRWSLVAGVVCRFVVGWSDFLEICDVATRNRNY